MPKKDAGEEFEPYAFFKTSLDARVAGLVLNVDYLENRHHNLIQKRYGRKTSGAHTRFVLWTIIFLFVQTFYTVDDSLKKE